MTKSGETATFTYNSDGLRVKKVCTTTGTTNYILHGKNIAHLTNGSNALHFFYDAQNRPAIVVYNGTAYGYVHNLQGDIIAIVDSAGTKVVEYKYDAWGKPLSKTGSMASTLGKWNPFRYRGYVYDEETNLYYLRSRYYAPERVRFINSDKFSCAKNARLAGSAYAYCRNAPIMMIDTDGFESECYLRAAYYIESYLVSREEYESYLRFADTYRAIIGNSDAMLPSLYKGEGCFGINNVSYTVEKTYKSTLWETVSSVSGFVGDTSDSLVSFVSMGIQYAALYFFSTSIDYEKVEGILSDIVNISTNLVDKVAFYFPNFSTGHNHTTHILRIERDAIMKTVELFKLDICDEKECPTMLIQSVDFGMLAK